MINSCKFLGLSLLLNGAVALPALSADESLADLFASGFHAVVPESPMPPLLSSVRGTVLLSSGSISSSLLAEGNETSPVTISDYVKDPVVNSRIISENFTTSPTFSFAMNNMTLLSSSDDDDDDDWFGPPPDGGDIPDPGGSTIPEPSNVSLVVLGLALVGVRRRK